MVAYALPKIRNFRGCRYVENGGGGGTNSVPIAREIFKNYFNIYDETDKPENKDVKKTES
jgi:hypothetical protein